MLMMEGGFMAPNINFNNPDEHSAKINVLPERLDRGFETFLSNSFGFGGTNSSLVVRRWKG
jgi:3-oxoacyl-[acyl-carrier-protein] synthase-1